MMFEHVCGATVICKRVDLKIYTRSQKQWDDVIRGGVLIQDNTVLSIILQMLVLYFLKI